MADTQNYTLKIDSAGRILIPASLRQELSLEPNSKIIASVQNGEIRLKSWLEKVREAQAFARKHDRMPGVSAVDMLIAERRREAETE